MEPLMLFLSSSMNVEMVYTILYGISKFTLLNYMKNEFTQEQIEAFQAMEYRVDRHGDTTVTIRQIKIKDIKEWDNMMGRSISSAIPVSPNGHFSGESHTSLISPIIQNTTVESDVPFNYFDDSKNTPAQTEPHVTFLDTKTEMTYHQLYQFGKLFDCNSINLQMLQHSFCPHQNRDQVFKSGTGSGKSGSFFFLTHDKRFMIKTINKKELKIMLDMLPSYIEHHLKYPDSLIGKIFGVFTVKRSGNSPVILALMENTVQLKSPQMLRYKFDLKGSTLGRKTKGVVTSQTDRKDLDWLELKQQDPENLAFDKINHHLIQILERDVEYLKSRGLIDYSLLLAVEVSAEKFEPKKLVEKRIKYDIATRK